MAITPEYKTFMNQIVEFVNEAKKNIKEEENNAFFKQQNAALEMQANGYCMIVKKAIEDGNKQLNSQLALEWKSAGRCCKYVSNQAKNLWSGDRSVPVFVSDNQVLQWILDYYNADDKAEVEKELADAEAKKIADEEKKAKKAAAAIKKAEKAEKDKKKAETLIEKHFALGYKYNDKDKAFFEKLQKEGLVKRDGDTWCIIDSIVEDEAKDEDDELEFEDSDEESEE